MNALEYFQDKLDEIIQCLPDVIGTESPSRDEEDSRNIVNVFAQLAKSIPAIDSVERIPAEGLGEHLLIKAFGKNSSEEKHFLLLGHTDTVHPKGSIRERPFRMEDGKIFGPGIFDMKANCVLIFKVLQYLSENDLHPSAPVTVLLTCDEEIGSHSGRPLVEREAKNAKACFVFEPSAPGGKVKTGRKGTGNYILKAHGIASHAGLDPQKGANAVGELARQIIELHKLNNFEIGTTVTVTTIKGGTTTNVVPAEAECEIDVRFTSMAEAERIDSEIRSLKTVDERVTLEVLGGINRPPLERTKAVAALFEKAKKIAASLGVELEETQVGGASDGNFVGAMGVPVLDGLGIAGDGAHADHEHILPDDIPFRGALLAGLLTAEI
ncbi:MAG TPA: M20 family metallopeptidase [Pyrinomonadaceae bacterium]|jgi:glutamate carboxypeptidase|nr:M20 family metallopeptidase [Pyrinomonadaceae bacterium]